MSWQYDSVFINKEGDCAHVQCLCSNEWCGSASFRKEKESPLLPNDYPANFVLEFFKRPPVRFWDRLKLAWAMLRGWDFDYHQITKEDAMRLADWIKEDW